ncbi:hypothetical protein Tco_1530840 [Tanacetum coccineum]
MCVDVVGSFMTIEDEYRIKLDITYFIAVGKSFLGNRILLNVQQQGRHRYLGIQQGITSSYGREEALTSSAFQHGGKMINTYDIGSGGPLRRTRQKSNLALKRGSSVLDDDIGSGGPLRRIRQKANLLMLIDKRELGYTALQQPDHASQKLLLMNESELKISTQTATKILQHLEKMDLKEKSSGSTKSPMKLTLDMLHGQALRSLEKVDSPKLLSYPHDNQKSKVQHHEKLHDRSIDSEAKVFERRSNCSLLNQFSSNRMISGVKAQLKIKTCDRRRRGGAMQPDGRGGRPSV